ncbi:uncharacterized protein LOC27208172 isoform X1 [Drosophila simulans]|uniref:uncharacterized protein LOC27208172 isoform X1 n=1 Tax=Drosophila simulans TaxID=7240 RepID=UPI00192D0F4E|nr:uncharacterized protein LOC27208172 isoform X1 [Drosophila simulans]
MCKKFSFITKLNICTKYRACIFWACINIIFGIAFIPLVVDFVKRQKLPNAVLVFGCICGGNFILSGFMLLIGVLKDVRCLVGSSIVFCGIGIFFIHWLIIPLALFFIFSFIVFNYYQVVMASDDRYRVPRRFS